MRNVGFSLGLVFLFASGTSGCGSEAAVDMGALPDLRPVDDGAADAALRDDSSVPSDLAVIDGMVAADLAVADLAISDLAIADLAVADLAVADLARAADLAPSADLTTRADLSVAADLASLPDLAANLGPASLIVDQTKGAQTASNLNGVLEPGETVMVETAWRNGGAGANVTGIASAFAGPAGPIYTLVVPSTSYGVVGAGATAACQAPGGCAVAQVSNPMARPAVHWDATLLETLMPAGMTTWRLHVGRSFDDTQLSSYYRAIETALHYGITQGCSPTSYCPSGTMTRANLALFVARALAMGDGNIPAAGMVGNAPYNCVQGGVSLFADVQATDSSCRHIHYLAARGVSNGCNGGAYCPSDPAPREQLALFVARAIALPGAVPAAYTDVMTGRKYDCNAMQPVTQFADVVPGTIFCSAIHYLWARGVVNGCMNAAFCPSVTATREQSAGAVVNGFGLSLYGP